MQIVRMNSQAACGIGVVAARLVESLKDNLPFGVVDQIVKRAAGASGRFADLQHRLRQSSMSSRRARSGGVFTDTTFRR